MASYKLLFKKSVAKDLRNLPRHDIKKILERITALASDPRGHGCKKLSGQEYYRVRKGASRIIYEITDERLIVHVIKIGHRSKIY
jgi:mRNA interferase RelE/StbE